MIPRLCPRFAQKLAQVVICASSFVSLAILLGCGGGDFAKLEELPASQYLKKPVDFLGNSYLVRAQIDSQIKWEKGVGRILAVIPEMGFERLPVYVPEAVANNIHIGQRFEMRVQVEEGGLIYVKALRKY